MSEKCECGSYAINPRLHGREEGIDPHLCDVCYWRARSNPTLQKRIEELEERSRETFMEEYNRLRERLSEMEIILFEKVEDSHILNKILAKKDAPEEDADE